MIFDLNKFSKNIICENENTDAEVDAVNAPSWIEYKGEPSVENPEQTINAKTLVANEISFESNKTYYYKTDCTDEENTSLNRRTGKVICSEYSGEHEIYKHGFVTTNAGKSISHMMTVLRFLSWRYTLEPR